MHRRHGDRCIDWHRLIGALLVLALGLALVWLLT
jgi:hypothetical protein